MTSKPAPWTLKKPWTYTDYAADKLFVCLADGPMGAPVVAIQVGHITDPVHVVPDDIPALIQALTDLNAYVTDYIEGSASNVSREERLAEITARAAAATKGPWGTYDDGTGRIDIAAGLEDTGTGYRCRREIAQTVEEPIDNDPAHRDWDEDDDLRQIAADAEFIAKAPDDIPFLLAELAELRAERDQARSIAVRLEQENADLETGLSLNEESA